MEEEEGLQLGLSLCSGSCVPDASDGFSSSDEKPWQKKRTFCSAFEQTATSNGGGGISPVGWPPVRRKTAWWWMGRRGERSMHVKVNVEGVAITRKVNLGAHRCYSSLVLDLASMFGMEGWGEHELAYQDNDGDWLLAGDVPWRNFVESVQRMKVFRRSD